MKDRDEKNFKNGIRRESIRDLKLTLVIAILLSIAFIQNAQAGYLVITSLPSGALVFIDGINQGYTPKSIDSIAVGSHTITLKLTGYQDWSQTVYGGGSLEISASLVPLNPIATTAAATQGKFRVGPSVTLRPVTDVIGSNQDGIVELFMNNPSLNDVALNVDIRVSMPTGIHVYGESFVQGVGAGVVGGTFSVPPGTSRTIILVIKADKSALIGSHTLMFTGLYWPGNNKDDYTPVSLTYSVDVKEASNNPESSEQWTPTPMITPIQTRFPKTVVEMTTKSSATAEPESSNSYIYAGIGGVLILLIAIITLKRKKSSQVIEMPKTALDSPADSISEAPGIYAKTAFGYKGATIIYKVKIENNTAKPISDIKVDPYVPNVFLLKEKEKSISLIEPRSSQTVTFEIRPTGECGDCSVSGRVNYYDTVLMERKDIQLEPKSLSIICPMLHRKEITEDAWRDLVSGLVKAEETTTDIPMDGEGLFGIISDILKDLNLFMLQPSINKAPQIFRGTARFYGEGVKGLRYAAQIEVVGGARKSKLILKAWAEKEDALTGFYHGVLDEIEKRVKVKEYIDDSIVQYNVHIGDKIGTLVKDSVVQRSTFGAGARKCPDCGREVEANEKFCLECGAKL
ncbi:MAG: PEGA domain-containing protein [Candidatus Methanoperedens sp.]|nr:PEGA domain-containing protein [Candidatus Methanoperedens sp.]